MPYQPDSEQQLLLSEELTLSLKRFEFVGYYYYFTLFLSFIALFTSKLTIHSSILYWFILPLFYTTPISLILFMVELLFNM